MIRANFVAVLTKICCFLMNIGEGIIMVPNILVFVLIVGTNAITWSSKLPKKPKEFGNKTGCYIREINDVIPFSESINVLGFCYVVHCTFKQIDYVSCGVTSQDHDTCVITETDISEPYPRCCPSVKCYENDLPGQEHKNGTSRRNVMKKQ